MVKKCADVELKAGMTPIYMEGFQGGGGVGMTATYLGPDTGYQEVLITSGKVSKAKLFYSDCDPTQASAKDDSSWTLCTFRSEIGLGVIPQIALADTGVNRLYYIGKAKVPVVDLHDPLDFRSYVPATPDYNLAWVFYGNLVVKLAGAYNLCVNSDDGTKLYVNFGLMVNNDGGHGMVLRCKDVQLAAGPHLIYMEGFNGGGPLGVEMTYSGPDTGGQTAFMLAGDRSTPPPASAYSRFCDPTAPDQDFSQWTVCAFRSEVGLSGMPNLAEADTGASRVYFVGKGRAPLIDLRDLNIIRSILPAYTTGSSLQGPPHSLSPSVSLSLSTHLTLPPPPTALPPSLPPFLLLYGCITNGAPEGRFRLRVGHVRPARHPDGRLLYPLHQLRRRVPRPSVHSTPPLAAPTPSYTLCINSDDGYRVPVHCPPPLTTPHTRPLAAPVHFDQGPRRRRSDGSRGAL